MGRTPDSSTTKPPPQVRYGNLKVAGNCEGSYSCNSPKFHFTGFELPKSCSFGCSDDGSQISCDRGENLRWNQAVGFSGGMFSFKKNLAAVVVVLPILNEVVGDELKLLLTERLN